jgi:hypothetical protein
MNAANPINAETLALKLQDRNFAVQVAARPRRLELLWFIQSRLDLAAMEKEILSLYGDRIGTAAMRSAGKPKDGRWTQEQSLAVWKEAQSAHRNSSNNDWKQTDFWDWLELHVNRAEAERNFQSEINIRFSFERVVEDLARTVRLDGDGPLLREGLARFNAEYFFNECALRLSGRLARHLEALCLRPDYDFSNSLRDFVELENVLEDYMDRHAAQQFQTLGRNRVTDMVFTRLRFARAATLPVLILGDSRVGKTKSVATWCAMHPGLARLVTIPDTRREWELYAAHADALGLPYTPATGARRLKLAVESTIRNSGLFLAYDEFHFALPGLRSRDPEPKRLNWLRCQVVDRGVGCAFVATRQSYRATLDQFLASTKHQIEQWLGRVVPALVLPAEFDHCELLAAAKTHFPGTDEDLLALVVTRCEKKDSAFRYLKAVSAYAHFHAAEAGRQALALEDVDAACEMILADVDTPATPRRTPAASRRPLRADPAPAAPPACEAVARALLRPEVPDRAPDFDDCSLESSCPIRGGVELQN